MQFNKSDSAEFTTVANAGNKGLLAGSARNSEVAEVAG